MKNLPYQVLALIRMRLTRPQAISKYTIIPIITAGSKTESAASPGKTEELKIPVKGAVKIPAVEYKNDTNPFFGLAPRSLNMKRKPSRTSIMPRT